MTKVLVNVKVVDDSLRDMGLPFYRRDGDAGADLYVILPEDQREHGLQIFPHERHLLSSGMKLELPEGYYARIVHRSSTEKKHRLRVIEGIVDQGYRGLMYVQVSNDNSFPITLHHGDRVAQLVIAPIIQGDFQEVDELGETDRGDGGFGSTGAGGK